MAVTKIRKNIQLDFTDKFYYQYYCSGYVLCGWSR